MACIFLAQDGSWIIDESGMRPLYDITVGMDLCPLCHSWVEVVGGNFECKCESWVR
jgi:hypothetical protein